MSNINGDENRADILSRRLRVLAKLNVERKVRLREDVDLMSQYRFEMLLLKAQMDTILVMLGEHGVISKGEFADRYMDYLQELIEQLQKALHVSVMNDGSIIRLN